MALVLILAGLVPGLIAAGLALGAGAGFLLTLAAYMAGGLAGMLAMAGYVVMRHKDPECPPTAQPPSLAPNLTAAQP